MRILYVSSSHAPGPNGAEMSARTLLQGMSLRGAMVHVLTNEINQARIREVWGESVAFRFTTDEDLEQSLRERLKNFAPDVVFTQSLWAAPAIRLANAEGIPNLSFVRSFWRPERLQATAEENPTQFVANSPAIAQYIRESVGREALMLYPLIDPAGCLFGSSRAAPEFVTMINPVREKGGELFDQVAHAMPGRKFHAVRGWTSKHGDIPRYVEMTSPNIFTSGPHRDLKTVYSRTRLLLVPSLWREAFGRVVIEAMINGIPVIASDRGALPWVVGEGGSVLSTRDPEEWAEAVAAYDHPAYYDEIAQRARDRASFFDMDRQLEEFARAVEETVNKTKVR